MNFENYHNFEYFIKYFLEIERFQRKLLHLTQNTIKFKFIYLYISIYLIFYYYFILYLCRIDFK